MLIDSLLRRQSGVISLAQAVGAGMSRRAVERMVCSGRWERVHPGVYRSAVHEFGAEARLRAAALWAGPDATVHGVSAAWWHGLLDEAPAPVQVTVPRSRRAGHRPGVRVRRRDLAAADHVPLRLVRVTDLPLTVLEAALCLGPAGGALLDRALQRRVRFPAVYRAYCRNLGSRGSTAVAALLGAAADRAASQAERLLVRLLRAHGVSGWRLGYRFGPFLIDLAFPAERVAVEVDGWAWHVDAERFAADRRRQNALVTAGWTVLRFTWHDLDGHGARVVGEIRSALARAGAPPMIAVPEPETTPRVAFGSETAIMGAGARGAGVTGGYGRGAGAGHLWGVRVGGAGAVTIGELRSCRVSREES